LALFPEKYSISNVPLQKDYNANHCIPASLYMVLKYYDFKKRLDNPLPTYEELLSLFPQTRRVGYPPAQVNEWIKTDSRFDGIEIKHFKASSIMEVEHHIRENKPLILIYDISYCHSQLEAKNSHASVMVGYTSETIIVNDTFHGSDYRFDRNRFNIAWRLKEQRYILIEPPRGRLDRWMPQ